MLKFEKALICNNGHILTDCIATNQHLFEIKHCRECGATIISTCPSCNTEILGCQKYQHDSWATNTVDTYYSAYTLPNYCHFCAHPYPWIQTLIREFEEIIDMADELDEVDKALLKEKFPHILTEAPGTSAAALRISKTLKSASAITIQALKSAVCSKIAGHALELLGWK